MLALLFIPCVARADVSLLVLESVGVAGEFTGSGHTAIYFSNICAESPVQLRLCRAGEQGVVVSTYPEFGKNSSQEWIAVPVNTYLYGIENERDIPLYANGKVRNFLRENYRKKNLVGIVPDNPDGTMPEGGWRTMLTMAFNRDIYSFNIKTTPDEDAQFLKEFNSLPSKGEFNTFSRNCADFTRKIINRYFPGAARRDVLNDFGITTPKAIARSLAGYATKHPERLFYVTKYSQVAGPIWRSYDNRNFSEMAFTSKKYVIPSLLFEPPLLAIFAGVYLTTGRFSVHNTYKKYATSKIAKLTLERSRLKETRGGHSEPDTWLKPIAERIETEKLSLFGDYQTWEGFKANFAPVLDEAIAQGLFKDTQEVKTFFRDLEIQSEPGLDQAGAPLLKVRYYGEERALGLTRNNILSEFSDRELAYKLMLVKIYSNLNALEKDRSSLVEFRADWNLMRELSFAFKQLSASSRKIERHRPRFLENPPPVSLKRMAMKSFISITH